MAGPDDEQTYLEELTFTLQRRLRIIEQQIARFNGDAVPAHLLLEKEDVERQYTEKQRELRRRWPETSVATQPPYLGLSTFQEQDAARFYGREELVEQLLARIEHESFVAVLGPSGSGKSSVVLAGLVPALKANGLPASAQWQYLLLRPGTRPLDALAVALTNLLGGDLQAVMAQREALTHSDDALVLAAELLRTRTRAERLVVVIDQSEELWSLMPTESEARQHFLDQQQQPFVRLLLTAATTLNTPVRVIVTMRADFLHRVAEHRDFARLLADHLVLVSPLAPNEFQRTIERPANDAGGMFEPGLVQELMGQVINQAGALPLLEYTLLELWTARDPDGTMTWRTFQALGGVEGALAARADAILYQFYPTDSQQAALKKVLLRLVQPGDGAADTRRRMFLTDLVATEPADGAVQALLQPLADARLITTGQDAVNGMPTVELAHEALIRAWPTFQHWINESRVDLRLQVQLEDAAKAWEENTHSSDFLWSGLRLATINAWRDRTEPLLSQRDQYFLTASDMAEQQRTAQQRSTRFFRRAALVLVVAFVLALSTAGYILILRNQAETLAHTAEANAFARATAQAQAQHEAITARTAEAQAQRASEDATNQRRIVDTQRLAFAAQSLRQTAPETALLLGYEAGARDDNAITEQTVRDNLDQITWAAITLPLTTGGIRSAVFSPDGQRILTVSFDGTDGTARLYDAAGQPLVTLQDHTEPIDSAVFSPDSKTILTINGTTARLWDLQGNQIARLTGHTKKINSAVFSPDGQRVLTASQDKTAWLWDLQGKQLVVLQGATSAVFSPNNKTILTTSDDDLAQLWDLQGKRIATLQEAMSAVFSPDGQRILTIDGTAAQLWDLTGKALAPLPDHRDLITNAVFSPDGQHILTASTDGTAWLWDLQGNRLATLQGHTKLISSAVFSPDGQRILTASLDGTARLWDLQGNRLATLQGHTTAIESAVFSPDGKRVLTASNDETVRLWDATSPPLATFQSHLDGLMSAVFSPDGQYILTAANDDTARLWDLQGKQFIKLQGVTLGLLNAVFSPDGKHILTIAANGTAQLWDMRGEPIATFQGSTNTVFSSDGQRVLTTDGTTARLWDLQGKQLVELQGVTIAAFSPDGQRLITITADKIVQVWDLLGKLIATRAVHIDAVESGVFSPDRQHILTASVDGTAQLWDLTGKPLVTLQGHTQPINSTVFSPDGQRILTASYDGTARLWDATGQPLATLQGHAGDVKSAVFSPDGQRILTASADGTARLWDATGQPLATLRVGTHTVESAVFSPDSQRILVASEDGIVRQYWTSMDQLLKVVACRVGRGLTDEEVQQLNIGTPRFDFSKRQCPPVFGAP